MKRTILAMLLLAVFPLLAESVLRSGRSECVIATHEGARITSWKVNGEELLWMPSVPQKDDGKWRHGGIPLVWPWVGSEYPDGVTNGPLHGVAWQRPFKIEKRRKIPSGEAIDLSIEACGLRGDYTIAINYCSLRFSFKTTNISAEPRKYAMAIHPYFRLPERDFAVVEGLDGLRYRDTRDGYSANGVWKGLLPITNWTDHVFYRKGEPLFAEIRDVRLDRMNWLGFPPKDPKPKLASIVIVRSAEAASFCVWNPGEEWATKGAPLFGELEENAWRHILSVEPCSPDIGDMKPLQPGESRVLTAEFSRAYSL